uniref:putative pre-16S rRNA nuclease n=1 Tax=Erigeron canadensis TaxID=72917 RepID=UPI001CB90E9A|nr:putative pre-16S rRNA nuclease [Erigeron canadensis]
MTPVLKFCRQRDKKDGDIAIMDELKSKISEDNLSGFIMGYPTYRSRTVKMTSVVENFVDGLDRSGKFPDLSVCYWNEFGSSKNVQLLLEHLGLSRNEFKRITDMFAASGILQGYLDFHNNPGSKPWSGVKDDKGC